ncbi:MAG: hypothetical protein HWD92_13665 [Flavobacteriia bacterium]|nr:hypothetical protein [Flavobacteriia bacterium]
MKDSTPERIESVKIFLLTVFLLLTYSYQANAQKILDSIYILPPQKLEIAGYSELPTWPVRIPYSEIEVNIEAFGRKFDTISEDTLILAVLSISNWTYQDLYILWPYTLDYYHSQTPHFLEYTTVYCDSAEVAIDFLAINEGHGNLNRIVHLSRHQRFDLLTTFSLSDYTQLIGECLTITPEKPRRLRLELDYWFQEERYQPSDGVTVHVMPKSMIRSNSFYFEF